LVPALAALVFAWAMIPSALAQCGMPTKLAKPAAWHPQMGGAHILQTAGREEEDGPAIVGMWHVTFTAKTSNGKDIPDTVIDNALAVWHSDKTEIMNSVRPPQDGNFCLGVWEQTGRSTYYLSHFPWFANQFPNDTNNGIGEPQGPTHITETITLASDCNHFAGTFTLDAYDTTGRITQSFTGVVTATRVTTSTTVPELLWVEVDFEGKGGYGLPLYLSAKVNGEGRPSRESAIPIFRSG
jgi:hypothetical protein